MLADAFPPGGSNEIFTGFAGFLGGLAAGGVPGLAAIWRRQMGVHAGPPFRSHLIAASRLGLLAGLALLGITRFAAVSRSATHATHSLHPPHSRAWLGLKRPGQRQQ